MNDAVKKRFLTPLRGSLRAQLLAALMAILLVGSITLALIFFFQARAVALKQMRNSYLNLGVMVAGLSSYDVQFNQSALKDTVDSMVQADDNILWVEVVDEKGKRLIAGGKLQGAPYGALEKAVEAGAVSNQSTPMGSGLLVRVPIETMVQPSAGLGEIGFEMAPQPSAEPQKKVLGELRIVTGLAPLVALKHGYLVFGSLVILLGMVAGFLLSIVLTRYFTAPIYTLTEYAKRVSSGNLERFKGEVTRQDELGRLLASFQEMSVSLARIVRETREAFHHVEEGTQTMRKHLLSTLGNIREQESDSVHVTNQVASIQAAVEEIAKLMEGLSALAEEVSSSVLQMIASIEEIAGNTEGLNDAVSTSASTLTQNVAANKQIDASAERLNLYVEETSSAMTEMEESIRQIEANAGRTKTATEEVAGEAQAGILAVEESNKSIELVRQSFEDTSSKMKLLGQRSRDVGNILAVIDEVMEQTHLLALNAAIIAAQAGEHGKPFAVVADEIKDLAAKTSVSTQEIAGIIDSVQRDVQQVVEAVGGQRELVENTVATSREAAKVFNRIQEGVKPSLQMVQEIARATGEQAKGAAGIVRSTEQLRDFAQQLRQAIKEQTSGSEQILDAVNRIRSLSEEMKRATAEQSAGSTLIRQAMDRLTGAVSDVLDQNQAQSKANKAVDQTMSTFVQKGKASVESIEVASDQLEALAQRAEDVAKILSQFKIKEG